MNTILAFSAEQTCRLTGLSPYQLSYWSKTSFFPSEFGTRKSKGAFSRVYSFRDVVGLRTLAILRNRYRVPLQRLRELGQYLAKSYTNPWSQLVFFVVGNQVFYEDQEAEAVMSGRKLGQTVFPVALHKIAEDVQEEADKLRYREPAEHGKIARNRYLMSNEPVIKGTRIPTRSVWNLHMAGYSEEAISQEYPSLTREDIAAAIEFEQSRRKRKAG